MQFISKPEIKDLLRFIEQQIVFTIQTTEKVKSIDDFLLSQNGMILFNSTCMCLQSIGEVIRQLDDKTKGELFCHYPQTPWKQIIGMRNIISHEYLSVDPNLILDIVKEELQPLLGSIRLILKEQDFS